MVNALPRRTQRADSPEGGTTHLGRGLSLGGQLAAKDLVLDETSHLEEERGGGGVGGSRSAREGPSARK